MKLYKNYIDGKWLESESKDIIQVDDPATGKIIGEISCAKKNEVDLAVSAAKAAFNSRILVDMPLLERARLMHRIADETRKVADEGGKMLCYENGKMLGSAIKEFNDVADMFDYMLVLLINLKAKQFLSHLQYLIILFWNLLAFQPILFHGTFLYQWLADLLLVHLQLEILQ